jgi:hypothetical protein
MHKVCSEWRSVQEAWGKGQIINYAATKDAQSLLRMEECALDMVQRSNYAASRDVQTKPEDFVGATEKSPNAVLLNAPTMPSIEEFVLHMGQKSRNAAVKDVHI